MGFDEEEVKLIEECSRKYEVEISQVTKNSAPEVDQKVKVKGEKGSVLKKDKKETKEEKEKRREEKKIRKTKLKEEKKAAKENKLIKDDTENGGEEAEYEVDYNGNFFN